MLSKRVMIILMLSIYAKHLHSMNPSIISTDSYQGRSLHPFKNALSKTSLQKKPILKTFAPSLELNNQKTLSLTISNQTFFPITIQAEYAQHSKPGIPPRSPYIYYYVQRCVTATIDIKRQAKDTHLKQLNRLWFVCDGIAPLSLNSSYLAAATTIIVKLNKHGIFSVDE